jgi:predicted transcriptional regulator
MNKHKTSVAMSQEAERLLRLLAEKLGISKSAVLEIAIRWLARQEKVKLQAGYKAWRERKCAEDKELLDAN